MAVYTATNHSNIPFPTSPALEEWTEEGKGLTCYGHLYYRAMSASATHSVTPEGHPELVPCGAYVRSLVSKAGSWEITLSSPAISSGAWRAFCWILFPRTVRISWTKSEHQGPPTSVRVYSGLCSGARTYLQSMAARVMSEWSPSAQHGALNSPVVGPLPRHYFYVRCLGWAAVLLLQLSEHCRRRRRTACRC
jgi:hypothetical protein